MKASAVLHASALGALSVALLHCGSRTPLEVAGAGASDSGAGSPSADAAAPSVPDTPQNAYWPMVGRTAGHVGYARVPGADSATIAWSRDVPCDASPVIDAEGTLYVFGAGSVATALRADGSIKWQSHVDAAATSGGPALGTNGLLYVGGGGSMTALRTSDGSVAWSRALAGQGDTPIVVGDDGTIYVATTSWNGSAFALREDGTIAWSYYPDTPELAQGGGPLALGPDGTVYMAHEKGLYALDRSGHRKWFLATSAIASWPTVGDDGTIYVRTSGAVLAIDADGTQRWSSALAGSTSPASNGNVAVGADATIYAAAGPTVVALHADGSVAWSALRPSGFLVVDSERAVFGSSVNIGSGVSQAWALAADGTKAWMVPMTPPQTAVVASVAVGAGHRTYLCASSKLIAFGSAR